MILPVSAQQKEDQSTPLSIAHTLYVVNKTPHHITIWYNDTELGVAQAGSVTKFYVHHHGDHRFRLLGRHHHEEWGPYWGEGYHEHFTWILTEGGNHDGHTGPHHD